MAVAAVMALSSVGGAQNATTGTTGGTVGTTQTTTTTNPYSRMINQGPLGGFGTGFQSSLFAQPGTNFVGPLSGISNGPGPLGGMQNAQGPLGPALNGVGPLTQNQIFAGRGGGTRFRTSSSRIISNFGGPYGAGMASFGYFTPYVASPFGYASYSGGAPQFYQVPVEPEFVPDFVPAAQVPVYVPTNDLNAAVPTRASRNIDARILSDGTLLVRWTGDPSTVRKVTFALLDANRREIVTKTSTRLPIEARFSLTNKTDFYRVDVVYSDGAISSATKAI